MRERQAKRIDLRSKSLRCMTASKEWQLCFLCGFQVVLDDLTDQFALIITESHGLIIGESTSHVPAHFQRLVAYGSAFLLHLVQKYINLVWTRG